MSFPPLHVITDDAVLADRAFPVRAATVLEAGGASLALHLRGPRTHGRDLFAHATALLARARETGGRLIINDRIDVARAAAADGVQLGSRSLDVADARAVWPKAWIGRSVHSPEEAREAARTGTDFAMLGTIYATPTHPDRRGAGPELVRATTRHVTIPVVAIGGMTAGRVGAVAGAGAAGVAVLRAVWYAHDPAHAVVALLGAWERDGRRERAR